MTTGHAVINANAKDGGRRRFVLVEMMDYAESVTAERVRRVIAGNAPTGETPVAPVGYGFYELGPQPMIDGVLNEEVATEKIREYVWHTETRGAVRAQCGGETPPPHEGASSRGGAVSAAQEDPYLLGVAYYFCYKKEKSMTLNRSLLKKIKTKAESYVIYADACTLSPEELEKLHITFRKIPRDITRF